MEKTPKLMIEAYQKIQIKIQGEELRVDGKKKDDLQEAMNAIKSIDIGLPIDFVNFRD